MNRVVTAITSSRIHARSRTRLIDAMLEGMALPAKGSALEVGCGAGFSSAHLAGRYGMRTIGTDAESDRIETAGRKNGSAGHLSFLVADATALPFEDSYFDLALSQNVFHHIPEWKAAAREVARVVRPGGLFLFSDIREPGKLMRLLSRLEKDHGFHATDDLVEAMAGLGFEAVRRSEPAGTVHREYAILFRNHLEDA